MKNIILIKYLNKKVKETEFYKWNFLILYFTKYDSENSKNTKEDNKERL